MALGSASVRHYRLRLTFPEHVQKRLDEFPKIGHFYTFLWGGPQVEGTRKSRWSRVGTSKIRLDFYSVICLVRWIMVRIGKVGREVVKKAWLSLIIKLFRDWLSRPLIIRLFPPLDYHESVIHAKTSRKGLIWYYHQPIKLDSKPWGTSPRPTPGVNMCSHRLWCPVTIRYIPSTLR